MDKKCWKSRGEAQVMAQLRQCDEIFQRKEVTGNVQIAAVIAPGQADGRLRIRGRASTHNCGTDGASKKKAGNAGRGCPGSWLPGEEIAGTRKSNPRQIK